MVKEGEKITLIIGAGFGGLAAALALAKKKLSGLKIRLVSDKPHFEYHPSLYRVVTGRSPLEVCVPIAEVLDKTEVEFVIDAIVEVDCRERIAFGRSGSRYRFDYLVLALGSETVYFDIPGLKRFSFGFKSINEAIRLKEHLHQLFQNAAAAPAAILKPQLVIIGAGPSGVELAGELAVYAQKLARQHSLAPAGINIDLFEAAPRILPSLPAGVSRRVEKRLRSLGVNIFVNRPILGEKSDEVSLRGITVQTGTVIWTSGVKPNSLYQKIAGLVLDQKGRVVIDDYLQARGREGIFAVGDGAATAYTGMAQTAINDGSLAAENISRLFAGRSLIKYQPRKPYYSLPVGPVWAATLLGPVMICGWPGWILRRFADLRFFLSILPPTKALTAFQSGKTLCEYCSVCAPEQKEREGLESFTSAPP